MLHLNKYSRRHSQTISIANTMMGSQHPIRVQSMTNTDTMDTQASVEQAIRIFEAGGELVRFTAQGVREAENVKYIKAALLKHGYNQPVVVDIHFNHKAAYEAAKHADKVRINPGNFADGESTKSHNKAQALQHIKTLFIPFLDLCKKHKTAIRIGVNHGSLSERIMATYGNTPEGMVASCMEYLHIAQEQNFKNIVISIKSSNTRVMVHTVRLLAHTLEQESMPFPLHLGVTEAGDAEDGRIKSAVGIGTLLCDGIGDTIRVSLSEAPEKEIPVTLDLIKITQSIDTPYPITEADQGHYSPYKYKKQASHAVQYVGGDNKAVVFTKTPQDLKTITLQSDKPLTEDTLNQLREEKLIIIAKTSHANVMAAHRSLLLHLAALDIKLPVILAFSSNTTSKNIYMLEAAAKLGGLLLDGFGDGILLEGQLDETFLEQTAYNILQASRVLFTKTEYISCPGCGRTLFGLEEVIEQIKINTSHLTGLKIGIMGCIVNGPGEMADADYGYVGAARGKISLYKGQECIKKNIPQDLALKELISLIKDNGDWKDKI